jgi:hypothetical protein
MRFCPITDGDDRLLLLDRLHGSSPFGFSGVLDMKSLYAARSGPVFAAAT